MADEGPNWLGLLKWSLAHTDGTSPSDAKAMSDENKAFLTKVRLAPCVLCVYVSCIYCSVSMSITLHCITLLSAPINSPPPLHQSIQVMEEGIKNEPKRMREIMLNIAVFLEEEISESKSQPEGFAALSREEQGEQLLDELEELQDIVEQIDMAQVFAGKMDGLGCILDLVEDKKGALVGSEIEVRLGACSVLGTLSQNNPQVSDVS